MTSPTGEVLRANRLAHELLGDSIEGKRCEDVLGLSIESLREGGDRLESQTGDSRLGLSVDWLWHDGHEYCAIVLREISQLVTLRADRERLLQLAAVGATMPSVLHEVRNPLAAVQTGVELMIEDVEDERVREDLFSILGELRYVKQTLQGLGTVGQSLASAQHEAVDHAIEEAARLMCPTAQAAGVNIEISVGMMPLLKIDTAVVRGIIVNLVNNAIHACSQGDTIRVAARLEDRDVRIEVADTGAGMSEATLARCTELFFSTKRSGSGIGLALVVETVRGAGGDVDINSALGAGTTVAVRIPAHIEQG